MFNFENTFSEVNLNNTNLLVKKITSYACMKKPVYFTKEAKRDIIPTHAWLFYNSDWILEDHDWLSRYLQK